MGIPIPTSPSYANNFDGHSKGHGPCCVCGKSVTKVNADYVRVDLADDEAITVEEAKDRAEVSEWVIGSNCLRRHPELKPYLI